MKKILPSLKDIGQKKRGQQNRISYFSFAAGKQSRINGFSHRIAYGRKRPSYIGRLILIFTYTGCYELILGHPDIHSTFGYCDTLLYLKNSFTGIHNREQKRLGRSKTRMEKDPQRPRFQ
jgi:hypothetical protein